MQLAGVPRQRLGPERWRRVAAVCCGLALAVALIFAGVHRHELSGADGGCGAACLYCSGGIVAAEPATIVVVAQRVWLAAEAPAPLAPQLRRQLPLAHSGNAPPA